MREGRKWPAGRQFETPGLSSRGLMDRALDLKPKVVGSNPGSGRKCPQLR